MTHTRTGYYVTAFYDTARNRLCGPFLTLRAATRMVEPVRRAIARDPGASERLRAANIGCEKVRGATLRPGTMDYALLRLDDVVEASKDN